ncbi:neurogenic locus notch homolog protein 3-like [Haliotis cracherodii]|uniref:neurogenic locus notch homolog protein 3-like n=1 Tax=Haliotis cracherodii TaxID=6455 RepID=UPI0039EB9107
MSTHFKLVYVLVSLCVLVLALVSANKNTTDSDDDLTALSSTLATTTLRPMSQRQCFHGFVCVHGICSATKSSCNCDSGWSGIFCQTPCGLDCGSNGVCDVFVNGTTLCSCNFDYTGSRCEKRRELNPTKHPDVAQPTTTVGSNCVAGFPCRNGHCPAGQLTCVCDKGWSGTFCGTPCSLDCGEKGICSVIGGQLVCVCEWGYTGQRCGEKLTSTPGSDIRNDNKSSQYSNPITKETSSLPSAAFSSTFATSTTSFLSTTTVTSTLRPLSQRRCLVGFTCQNGYCKPGQLKCFCDAGWVGIFCQTPCNLDCGTRGQCRATPAGQICECSFGYTGDRCKDIISVVIPQSTLPLGSTQPQTVRPSTSLVMSTAPSTTILPPLSARQCVPGSSAFVCKHGTCYKEATNRTTIVGFALKCICERGWIGVFCHEPCPLDCGTYGRCDIFKNGTLYCSCAPEYMGPTCATLRPKPQPEVQAPSWYWWVVGSCVVLLVILLILLVILPYILWKRRYIFIMKIVYMFQPFEEDDDKLFDAFVSYKSTKLDEDFVVHTLYPKLEKNLNFKLCLHFRDFMPGETIANNIIEAVENSRRTIMILTPSYIQSEFCRFEYQRAQHEMLKRKQRIIPIVLQDISEDRVYMDDTLSTILDTITYIEWPKDGNDKRVEKFWKRVELSMPKRRSRSSSKCAETSNGQSTEVSSVALDMLPETHSSSWPEFRQTNNACHGVDSSIFDSIDINDCTQSQRVTNDIWTSNNFNSDINCDTLLD